MWLWTEGTRKGQILSGNQILELQFSENTLIRSKQAEQPGGTRGRFSIGRGVIQPIGDRNGERGGTSDLTARARSIWTKGPKMRKKFNAKSQGEQKSEWWWWLEQRGYLM